MGNILVCDDERSICSMLDIALRLDGHHVETVTSGGRAIQKLDSALYDVLVTDVRMPGISGMEVLRHARRVGADELQSRDYCEQRLQVALSVLLQGNQLRRRPSPLDHRWGGRDHRFGRWSSYGARFALRTDPDGYCDVFCAAFAKSVSRTFR